MVFGLFNIIDSGASFILHWIPFYHFLTSLCAIIGGVFTVTGLIDSVVRQSLRSLKTKVSLGKN